MHQSLATKLQKIDRLKEIKPDEQLQHLFIDTESEVRDRFVESMWNDLYNGEPLDDTFKHNFALYYEVLLGHPADLPADLFDNVSVAHKFVSDRFGLLYVAPFDADKYASDEALKGFTHLAQLRTRYATHADGSEYCYAPSELYAILLTVVNTFRQMITRYVSEITKTN